MGNMSQWSRISYSIQFNTILKEEYNQLKDKEKRLPTQLDLKKDMFKQVYYA